MELIIDRATWLRGDDESCLLRQTDGKMCCLGFYSLSCGLSKRDIVSKMNPYDITLRWSYNDTASWLFNPDRTGSFDCACLMSINDDTRINEEEREYKIAKIFAKHDVIVKFV